MNQNKKANKQLNRREFKNKSFFLHSKPFKLFMELTLNCNFRCIMCPREVTKGYDPVLDMPFPLYKKIADELFPYAEYIDLRGYGESIILKDWEKYLDYALKFKTNYGLITNLSVKNDAMWEKMIKNNFFLGVSFDGATKETFEYIRQGAHFETIMYNLQKIVEYCKKYKKPEDRIKLMVTVQKENIHELPQIMKIAKNVGVKEVQFSPSRVYTEDQVFDRDDIFNKPQILRPIFKKCINLARKYKMELSMTGSFNLPELEKKHGFRAYKSCDHPWTCLYITYDGKVGPCNHLMNPGAVLLGDLKRQTFEEAWNGLEFQLFRKMILSKHKLYNCDWCHKYRYGD